MSPATQTPEATPETFVWSILRHLAERADLRSHVDHGDAVSDFVIAAPTGPEPGAPLRRVAVHLGRGATPAERQALDVSDLRLAESGAVDAVVRFRGSDLLTDADDAVYLLSRWEPGLFSSRARVHLETLASAEGRAVGREMLRTDRNALVFYGDEPAAPSVARVLAAAEGSMPFLLGTRYEGTR